MSGYIISGGEIITADGIRPNSGIYVAGGKLAEGAAADAKPDLIDAGGMYIAPGFIDLHVHGGAGHDIFCCSDRSIREIASFHAGGGTTSWLATIAPATEEEIKISIRNILPLVGQDIGGARILGIHLEGPYLNKNCSGSLDPVFLRPVDMEEMAGYINLCRGTLKMVTLAPELPRCTGLIKFLKTMGIVASAGHSAATYDEACSAFKSGVSHVTHLFNASSPLHHREPGLVGAALENSQVTAEIIVDGYHLHPLIIKMLLALKGPQSLALVTDAASAAGMPDGEYLFNKRRIIMKNKKISLPGGSLAGSSLTMIEAVRNIIDQTGIALHQAVAMASLNPARVANLARRKGQIKSGLDADLVILDKKLNVRLTMSQGVIVYSNIR